MYNFKWIGKMEQDHVDYVRECPDIASNFIAWVLSSIFFTEFPPPNPVWIPPHLLYT